MEIYDGYYIFVVNGMLGRAPIGYHYAIAWYWVFMYAVVPMCCRLRKYKLSFRCAFAIMTIPVMFYYRWKMVCKWVHEQHYFALADPELTVFRGEQIPLRKFFLLLLIPSGAAAFETSFLTLGQLENESHREVLCQHLLNDSIWDERPDGTSVPVYPRNCIAAYGVSDANLAS